MRRSAVLFLALLVMAIPITAQTEVLAEVEWCESGAGFDDFTDELTHVYAMCVNSGNGIVMIGINRAGP